TSCQCSLCLYDRSLINEYENELKKFINIRTLLQQKNISNLKRFNYLKDLQYHYEYLTKKKFHDRPIGFINEFIDYEYILSYFQNENNENDIKNYLNNQQNLFLKRLSNVCRFTLPDISNPILLFGKQIEVKLI
ncbi:unnamed protein product, partial [Rotaria sp. Silwood1]